jgi:hypothetical protein
VSEVATVSNGEWLGLGLVMLAFAAYFVARASIRSDSRLLHDLTVWRARKPASGSAELAKWVADGEALLVDCDRKASAGDRVWNRISAEVRAELRNARLELDA